MVDVYLFIGFVMVIMIVMIVQMKIKRDALRHNVDQISLDAQINDNVSHWKIIVMDNRIVKMDLMKIVA